MLAVAVATAAACSGGGASAPAAARPSGSWPYPNGDLANTRQAPGSVITAATVPKLRQAWSFPVTSKPDGGTGALTAAPVVAGGVVYLQDMQANVYAIALATGKLRWEYKVGTAELGGPGPDGVAVAGGRVYGTSPHTAFALSAATGKPAWVDRNLLGSGQGVFDIQPQAAGGRVYLASSLGTGPGGGVLLALDAATGARLWSFATMTGSRSASDGAGGAWEPPLVGADGSVTFGTGNPYQAPAAGSAHPSPLLYADSDVNLDAATGALRWYYQAVPDDFLDHDLQTSPVAARIGAAGVIIAAGKTGEVYAINSGTGALVWKTPVGVHNGTDNDPALALAGRLHLRAPYTVEPGELGGVQSNLAVAGGSVYVVTNDLAFTYTSLSQVLATKTASAATGQVEALSLATGKVEWDTKVPTLPLGAATVSGNLVFTTLYTGELVALNRSTGRIVYRHQLPTSTNAPLDVLGNTILVAAGGAPAGRHDGHAQLIAYTVP